MYGNNFQPIASSANYYVQQQNLDKYLAKVGCT